MTVGYRLEPVMKSTTLSEQTARDLEKAKASLGGYEPDRVRERRLTLMHFDQMQQAIPPNDTEAEPK